MQAGGSSLNKVQHLAQGFSFWSIKTKEGVIKESQKTLGENGLLRQKDWGLDVVQKNRVDIEEIFLHTPRGVASLEIIIPYTAFQLKFGTKLFLFEEEKIAQGQIIGRVDNAVTGDCTCAIWDILEQKLYIDHCTNVKEFTPWREGIARFGHLSLEVIGVKLYV